MERVKGKDYSLLPPSALHELAAQTEVVQEAAVQVAVVQGREMPHPLHHQVPTRKMQEGQDFLVASAAAVQGGAVLVGGVPAPGVTTLCDAAPEYFPFHAPNYYVPVAGVAPIHHAVSSQTHMPSSTEQRLHAPHYWEGRTVEVLHVP